MSEVAKISLISIAISLILIAGIGYALRKGNEVDRVYTSKGIIEGVTNCRSGKHSLRCRVETDAFIYKDIDITDFPGDFLSIGDELGFMVIQYENSRSYYNCRNKDCVGNSFCHSWMPCYD